MVHDRASCRQPWCRISLRGALLAHKDDESEAG